MDCLLDLADCQVVPFDVRCSEVGVGTASQDVAGAILVGMANGAEVGAGGCGIIAIGHVEPVGQLAGPKAAPSHLDDVRGRLPTHGGGGPHEVAARGVQSGEGLCPDPLVDACLVGSPQVHRTGDVPFDVSVEVRGKPVVPG